MFRSLAHPNYRIWFIGGFISNIGAWMQITAQNWVVLTELSTNDALAVGITMALQFAPGLLLVPVVGLITDRFDRRRVLLITQSSLMALALGLGALLVFGHAQLWHLYVFAALFGIVNALDTPARQAFASDLIPAADTANAVALNAASFNAARMIGPAVAGLLIAVVGSGWVFIVNALTFAAVLIALGMLRGRHQPRIRAPRERGAFTAGFRYVWGRPDLMIVFLIVFLIAAFGMNFPIFSSTMAVEFGRGAGEYGLLNSIIAIGSLTGALLSARRERARIRIVMLSAAGFAASATLSALMPTFELFAVSTVLLGFTIVTMLTTANGYVQTTTDPARRGRVLALYFAVIAGGTPIGAPIVGAVANSWGPRWGLGVAAIAGGIAALIGLGWLIAYRGMRLTKHPSRRWGASVAFSAPPTAAISLPDRIESGRQSTASKP